MRKPFVVFLRISWNLEQGDKMRVSARASRFTKEFIKAARRVTRAANFALLLTAQRVDIDPSRAFSQIWIITSLGDSV